MQEKRRLHKLDTFCSKAEVVDATNAFLWPTYYTIYNKHYGLVKVECSDPVYMNQAVKGEQVYIKAPMYIDLDTEEKIVVLAPRIKESQVFKKAKN